MVRISAEDFEAGHEETKRRERELAARTGWKPGDPIVVSQTELTDLRQEAAQAAIDARKKATEKA
jgi:hypothetical protein